MPRPIQATVFPDAIRHNIHVARQRGGSARVWAVIKANAYGHGIERIYSGLTEADGLALLDLKEAESVRRLGWVGPILLLEGCFEHADLQLADRLRLTIVVHCDEQIRALELAAHAMRVPVYLKINSGMNRLGFPPGRARAAHARLSRCPAVGEITLMTHFANADLPSGVSAACACFEQATEGLSGARSLANSAATLIHPGTSADWIRPGILLYGSSPVASATASSFGLRAAMHLSSSVIAIQELEAGAEVGYGARFRADTKMRIAVIACGYADGYPRAAGNGTPVLVDGVRCELVGRVSMDMITVDVSSVAGAAVGSEVELWGARLSVDEVAHFAGTIGYELLCGLALRVPVRVGQ